MSKAVKEYDFLIKDMGINQDVNQKDQVKVFSVIFVFHFTKSQMIFPQNIAHRVGLSLPKVEKEEQM